MELDAYRIVSKIVKDYFGGDVQAQATREGNGFAVKVQNIPVYSTSSRIRTSSIDEAKFVFPGSHVMLDRNGLKMTRDIQAYEIHVFDGKGKSFPNPHIWQDARPCLGVRALASLEDIACFIIDTITWRNVSPESESVGIFAPSECTSSLRSLGPRDRWSRINKFKTEVKNDLGFDPAGKSPQDHCMENLGPLVLKTIRMVC